MPEVTWTKAEYDAAGGDLVGRLHSRILDLEDACASLRLERDGLEHVRKTDNAYLLGVRDYYRAALQQIAEGAYAGPHESAQTVAKKALREA